MNQVEHVDQPENCHLLLEFESHDLLMKWTKSSEHDMMIEKLSKFRNKKQ